MDRSDVDAVVAQVAADADGEAAEDRYFIGLAARGLRIAVTVGPVPATAPRRPLPLRAVAADQLASALEVAPQPGETLLWPVSRDVLVEWCRGTGDEETEAEDG